ARPLRVVAQKVVVIEQRFEPELDRARSDLVAEDRQVAQIELQPAALVDEAAQDGEHLGRQGQHRDALVPQRASSTAAIWRTPGSGSSAAAFFSTAIDSRVASAPRALAAARRAR